MKTAISLLLLVLSYLLGGIPWGFIFGKMKGIDIREHGSKNIGSTNVGRILGRKYAILTFLCDMAKGAIIVSLFTTGIVSSEYALAGIPMIYGLAAVLGHTFSPLIGFKGGKAVATGGGVVLAISPYLFILSLAVYLITIYKTKYVSLGSLAAAVFTVIGSLALYILNIYVHISNFYDIYFPIGCFLFALIVFLRHRNNITRLKLKQESKVNWGQKKNRKED